MSDLYSHKFLKLLKEDAVDEELERDAMEASLDDGIDAEEFDTDLEPAPNMKEDEVANAVSRRNAQMISELEGWISNIEEFLIFLNGEDPDSVQSRLASAEPDTIMDKMKQSQQTKISRVASDLASLHQNFLGFKAQTTNPKYKHV